MKPYGNIITNNMLSFSRRLTAVQTLTNLLLALGLLAMVVGCKTSREQPPSANSPAAAKPSAKAPSPSVSTPAHQTSKAPADSVPLFDGKTLTGWTVTDFAGHGEVKVEEGKMVLMMGIMTGVTWTNSFPKMNYEVELDTMRVEGNDFFCGLTFPVGDAPCSLILGGWGGGVVGLSSIDGEDAAHNETSKFLQFDTGRWYHVRLRVVPGKVQAWIDQEKFVDLDTQEKNLSIRIEMELSKPLGIATWSTTGAVKDIRLRKL